MINVSYALRHSGHPIAFEAAPEPPKVDGTVFTEVNISGEIVGLDVDSLSVSGRLSTTASQHCGRCGRETIFPIDCVFEEIFFRGSDDQPDSFAFEGSEIDPAVLAESLIVLALPIRVLCREDCKGLCPVCGKDRNEAQCTHE